MSQVDIKFDFPFDLNQLFSLQYSFDVLKQAIEYIAKNQASHAKLLQDLSYQLGNGNSQLVHNLPHTLDSKDSLTNPPSTSLLNKSALPSHHEEAKTAKDGTKVTPIAATQDKDSNNERQGSSETNKMLRDHDNVIKNLRNELNQLKEKHEAVERGHTGLNKSYEGYKTHNEQSIKEIMEKLAEHTAKVSQTENTVVLLKAMGGSGANGEGVGNGPDLLDALQIMVDNLRKECYASFGSRSDSDLLKRKIDEIQSHLRDADDKLKNHEIGISQCRDITDTNKLDIDELKRQIKMLMINTGIDSKRDSNYSSALANTSSKVELINDSTAQQPSDLGDLLRRLSKLEKEFDNKLDCDMFDNEIMGLRALIGNLENGTPVHKSKVQATLPSPMLANKDFSTKEVNQIKQMLERLPQIEDTQTRILKDLKNLNIQSIKEQIELILKQLTTFASQDALSDLADKLSLLTVKQDKHAKELQSLQDALYELRQQQLQLASHQNFASVNDLLILRSRMEYVEGSITSQKKLHNELQKALDEFKAEMAKKLENFDSNLLKELEAELRRLGADYQKFKDDNGNTLKSIVEQLMRKADKEELIALEARLLEKLNEMLQKLLNMFADKKDTNKRLTHLEKNMKSMLELLMSRNSPRQNEDDAMFTKKPLAGISCASCERNITNISGNMADYQPWKKLPFREPSDRISKYGPGFSKILSMMKPEQNQSLENSRIDLSFNQQNRTLQNTLEERSFVNDNSISVEMPQAVMTQVKNSARTGVQFHKNTHSGAAFGSRKNSHAKNMLFEESPKRDISADRLPQLNIRKAHQ